MIRMLRVGNLLTSHHDGDACCKQYYTQLKIQSVQWSWTHPSLSHSALKPLVSSALLSSLEEFLLQVKDNNTCIFTKTQQCLHLYICTHYTEVKCVKLKGLVIQQLQGYLHVQTFHILNQNSACISPLMIDS